MRKTLYKVCREYFLIKALGITALAFLMLISIAGAAPYVYITNIHDDTVTVIDTATNNITATVNVGNQPFGLAVNPAGTKTYVGSADNTVSVIDTAANTVIATVPVLFPYGVVVTPDGKDVRHEHLERYCLCD